ncbi:hypothetical protein C1N32_04205 [Vibrio diazotrophicus]|uniref:KilA-N domain-containing protein n=1 Tax=Vibrio diazotrophicus TaxID=685 RepID=A0A2J8I6R9_VIBDI|nr:KilA-N domain-containing protein [Vibrio diazotrophicus]PNI06209.1 hypothetical protein C1N32_04205 [Vibrio diazotrophicus]
MPNLTILSTDIRTRDGYYSLNDLHRVSGGEKRHQPHQFLRNEQTRELIGEVNRSANSRIAYETCRGGKNQGTWVCKELVYSYAMWISPKFHLQVIRAFDQMASGQQLPQLGYKPDHNIPINDLVYEIAQLRGVSTEQVRFHYDQKFSSQKWTLEEEFMSAAARTVLRRDLMAEIEKASPDMLHLMATAKQKGLRLVDESDYQNFQARLQMQQTELDKLTDEVMRVSRNLRSLSIHNLWS